MVGLYLALISLILVGTNHMVNVNSSNAEVCFSLLE